MDQFEERVGSLGVNKQTIEQYISNANRYLAAPDSPLATHDDVAERSYYDVIEVVDLIGLNNLRERLEEFKIGGTNISERTNISEYKFPLQYCWEHLKHGLSMGMFYVYVQLSTSFSKYSFVDCMVHNDE